MALLHSVKKDLDFAADTTPGYCSDVVMSQGEPHPPESEDTTAGYVSDCLMSLDISQSAKPADTTQEDSGQQDKALRRSVKTDLDFAADTKPGYGSDVVVSLDEPHPPDSEDITSGYVSDSLVSLDIPQAAKPADTNQEDSGQQERYDLVTKDYSRAMEIYSNVPYRKSKALESNDNVTKVITNVIATCTLENYMKPQSQVMAERILWAMGRTTPSKAYQNNQISTPSRQYIKRYFSSFYNDPIIKAKDFNRKVEEEDRMEIRDKKKVENFYSIQNIHGENKQQGSTMEENLSPYRKALKNIWDGEYNNIVKLCGEELENEMSRYRCECLLLRGTFHLLSGKGNESLNDFSKVLNMPNISKAISSNTLIKRGHVYMQKDKVTEALKEFDKALTEDPKNCDIYYYRGQLKLLIGKVEEAEKDFEKSTELNPKSLMACVQKCYTECIVAFQRHWDNALTKAMEKFEQFLSNCSDCAEAFALYGKALYNQGNYEKADENFSKALEIDPEDGNIYVHRGWLQIRWKQDIDQARKFFNKALEVNEKCGLAYVTLGSIEMLRGDLDHAIELFNKAISQASTEMEIAKLMSLREEAITRLTGQDNRMVTQM